MDFRTRYLTENRNTLLKGALMGAGAMMLGDHLSDGVHDFNDEMHNASDNGNYWNTWVNKAQGGLEHLKTDNNAGIHNPNPNPTSGTDKLHDIVNNNSGSSNSFSERHAHHGPKAMLDAQNHQSELTQKDQGEILGNMPNQSNSSVYRSIGAGSMHLDPNHVHIGANYNQSKVPNYIGAGGSMHLDPNHTHIGANYNQNKTPNYIGAPLNGGGGAGSSW